MNECTVLHSLPNEIGERILQSEVPGKVSLETHQLPNTPPAMGPSVRVCTLSQPLPLQ